MKTLNLITLILAIIGGLNWGLIGLFDYNLVAAIFGLGFAGFIPAYVLTLRQIFPAREASWRVPTLLMFGMGGMATGSWLAGRLYDYFGFYMPAFASGLAFNLANFVILGFLFLMARRTGSMKPVAVAA